MQNRLFEYDNNREFGPASDEETQRYTDNLKQGIPYILRGYHGYNLKMTVRSVRTPKEEKELYGV